MSKKVAGIILIVVGILLFCYSKLSMNESCRSSNQEMEETQQTMGYSEDQYSSNRMMQYGGVILAIAGIALIVVHHRHHEHKRRPAPAHKKKRRK
jgi:uncharacterized membrane protein HdeD (DUF308 family)